MKKTEQRFIRKLSGQKLSWSYEEEQTTNNTIIHTMPMGGSLRWTYKKKWSVTAQEWPVLHISRGKIQINEIPDIFNYLIFWVFRTRLYSPSVFLPWSCHAFNIGLSSEYQAYLEKGNQKTRDHWSHEQQLKEIRTFRLVKRSLGGHVIAYLIYLLILKAIMWKKD